LVPRPGIDNAFGAAGARIRARLDEAVANAYLNCAISPAPEKAVGIRGAPYASF
jgi:hypothetical protein